jgi:hypothetical protein
MKLILLNFVFFAKMSDFIEFIPKSLVEVKYENIPCKITHLPYKQTNS